MNEKIKNTIIIGAGLAGKQIFDEIKKHNNYKVVGFLDDDCNKKGDVIGDVLVLGTTSDLKKVIKDKNVDECFIAIPTASGKEIQTIIEKVKNENIKYKIIPRFSEIIKGTVNLSDLREPKNTDFLGRAMVKKDLQEVRQMIKGKKIMITGAGGSIGQGLVHELLKLDTYDLICLDNCEYNIFKLQQKYESFKNIKYIVASIQDKNSLDHIFLNDMPDIIFHAAAYKHVTFMEENVEAAIKNNIFGTLNVLNLCEKYCVSNFVMVSTDKAVNPTSVMGVTKRICEKMIETYSNNTKKTKYTGVRFGNVIGSSGSVIPIFKKQIRFKREITITDKDVERYFMTIPEACQLIIQSSTLGLDGDIFVLDMGKPIKILDLAKDMIRAYGLVPEKDVKIRFIGLRNGEKLTEELLLDIRANVATKYEKIYITNKEESFDNAGFMEDLKVLEAEVCKTKIDVDILLGLLKKLAPNFDHKLY